ncbi:MAG: D-2-hydroxyacid dehydrogenase family protein [Burkholderiales bacterium]|nr:D-2-hydroxyacid dehydrogenase family protein [Burkholderiales bacterium]
MKIAILDDYQDCIRHLPCFAMLAQHEVKVFNHSTRGVGQLAARLAPYDALVLIRERTHITKTLLEKLPNLKLISQTGKVGNHVDVAAATARGVCVVEGAGDPTAPAELAFALIMAARRKLLSYASHLKAGQWQIASLQPQHNGLGRVLKGQTLGIWGYGKIGKLMAKYATAFGMDVMVWGREASRAQAQADGHRACASKAEFFARADIVSLHLRLNEATQGIVTAEDLALMRPDALFVNTSRAELVQAGALLKALQQGHPGAAALDVFENEPLPEDDPLLKMENVLATPHLGYVEHNSYELYLRIAFQNVLDFAAGEPKNVVTA